jgi:hypothetical protein
MIELTCPEGTPTAKQQQLAPAVYLDHWALMDISNNEAYADRFVSAIATHGGTLALSWLNLVEFSGVSDPSNAGAAERLLERLMPNLFFLEPNVFVVIEREDQILHQNARLAPHADSALLEAFVGHDDSSLNPLSVRNFFTIINSADVVGDRDRLASSIAKQFEEMQERYSTDSEYRKKIAKPTRGKSIQHGTRHLLRESLGGAIRNVGRCITENDAVDYLHTIVAASYCDFLVIDGHWEAQLNQGVTRLRRGGVEFPVAQLFSGRRKGLVKFLDAIDAWRI